MWWSPVPSSPRNYATSSRRRTRDPAAARPILPVELRALTATVHPASGRPGPLGQTLLRRPRHRRDAAPLARFAPQRRPLRPGHSPGFGLEGRTRRSARARRGPGAALFVGVFLPHAERPRMGLLPPTDAPCGRAGPDEPFRAGPV